MPDSSENSTDLERIGRVWQIKPKDYGRRLDAWLVSRFTHIPQPLIQKLIRKGTIRLNGQKTEGKHRISPLDIVQLPEVFAKPNHPVSKDGGQKPPKPRKISPLLLDAIAENVIYVDKNYVVLNKPSGIAVHGGSRLTHSLTTLLPIALGHLGKLQIAHRIDKETSGCLLLARNWAALTDFHHSLRAREVHKEYMALLHLPVSYPEGDVQNKDLPHSIPRSLPADICIQTPLSDRQGRAQIAHSQVEILSQFSTACLAKITIKTGRRHQVRLHVQSIRQPVVGDRRYGLSARIERQLGLPADRLMLHAHTLSFTGDKVYKFTAPLPQAFAAWQPEGLQI